MKEGDIANFPGKGKPNRVCRSKGFTESKMNVMILIFGLTCRAKAILSLIANVKTENRTRDGDLLDWEMWNK